MAPPTGLDTGTALRTDTARPAERAGRASAVGQRQLAIGSWEFGMGHDNLVEFGLAMAGRVHIAPFVSTMTARPCRCA
jgi:hypothetical protein